MSCGPSLRLTFYLPSSCDIKNFDWRTSPGPQASTVTGGMIAVCACGEDRAECQACHKGFAQERAAGRECRWVSLADFNARKKTPPGPLINWLVGKHFCFGQGLFFP